MTTTIMEKQNEIGSKTTLARRVSDLFRADRKGSVSPMLLHRASIQKLRHCCQNLNLFPILFYAFDQGKAPKTPISKLNPTFVLARILVRIYRVYSSITYTIIRGLSLKSINSSSRVISKSRNDKNRSRVLEKTYNLERPTGTKFSAITNEREFQKFAVQKPKGNSMLLKLAVYFAPLMLAFQLIGILNLMIFGKFPAGFVFLVSSLIFLGCISMKVFYHDVTVFKILKSDKRKTD